MKTKMDASSSSSQASVAAALDSDVLSKITNMHWAYMYTTVSE